MILVFFFLLLIYVFWLVGLDLFCFLFLCWCLLWRISVKLLKETITGEKVCTSTFSVQFLYYLVSWDPRHRILRQHWNVYGKDFSWGCWISALLLWIKRWESIFWFKSLCLFDYSNFKPYIPHHTVLVWLSLYSSDLTIQFLSFTSFTLPFFLAPRRNIFSITCKVKQPI